MCAEARRARPVRLRDLARLFGRLSITAFGGPAALIVGVLAWVYTRYGTRPVAGDVLAGVKPVVVAVVSVAVVRLGRTAFTSRLLVGIGAAVLAAYLAGLT
ncbi:MAG TPA: chromate transporter, partial [Acidimicrobiia bacterium]|nr:chromate transporter [Acidimicrobiia bacterium]